MKTANRTLPTKNNERKMKRIIPCWAREWLWRLFDRTAKAFFEALFDRYAG